MKMKYLHRLLFAAAAAVALVSCNKEQDKSADGLETDGPKNYMGFTISMPSAGTKAAGTDNAGYVVGEAYENAIKTIHFYFYRNGAYVSWGYGDMKGKFTEKEQTSGEYEEILENTNPAQGVVVLESTMTIPNQVLCVINSRNPGWYRNKSLETVINAFHSGTDDSLTGNTGDSYKDFQFVETSGGPYFVMFTSPMYGTKAGQLSEKEVKYVNDIVVKETSPGSGKFAPESYIKNTRAEAEAKPLTIFVERMAARFDIDNLKKVSETIRSGVTGILKDDGSNFVDPSKMDASLKDASGNPLWDIEFLAWSVTAHNKKAYSLKHIDKNWFDPTQASTYGGWLQSGSSFENPVLSGENMFTRINWAMDPNYSTAQYPFANRDFYPHSARELIMVNPQSEQKYWSAEEVEENYKAAPESQGDILQRYSYENTFSKDGQSSPRVNGTMLLLYSKVKKAGAAYEDLYAYMGQMQTFQEYAAQLLSTMDAHGYTFYTLDGTTYKPIHKDATEGGALDDFIDPSKAYLKVVKAAKILDFYSKSSASYVDKSAETVMVGGVETPIIDVYPDMVVDLTGGLRAETFEPKFAVTWPIPDTKLEKRYADGYVTLVPGASMPKLYVNYHDNPLTPEIEYTEATAAEIAEGFLNGVVEPANMYREGRMYYAIPIEHYGAAVDNPTDKNPLEGNYGVVRNNFYQVSIGTFKSLGHGIDDVSEPIVPGDRKKPYYLAAKINILSWQVATQKHDLEE